MIRKKYIVICILYSILCTPTFAEQWKTYFAYNNVTQIAMSSSEVYAISDGSLYSVNKRTERLKIYNRQSGLNSTGITCIHYDPSSKQLIIGYGTGKIDMLSDRGVRYIGDLYDKDMTQRKTIHNVTIQGYTAYLSTAFGIQTLDLRTNRLVDSYWLRPNAQETDVLDVVIASDSIYAFTEDSLFCASMKSNLSDYSFWHRELRSGRISPDPEKGIHYTDTPDQWYAGNTEGIVRIGPLGKRAYKPQGPLSNIPYRMNVMQNKLWLLQGGRWDAQYWRPGIVMLFDGSSWTNIPFEDIQGKTGRQALDFMNAALDPKDNTHFFVTSFGTGLYEFRGTDCVKQYIAEEDNTLVSAVQGQGDKYTRLDCALFDADGNLWLLDAASSSQLQCLDASGTWHAVNLSADGKLIAMYTPCALFFDGRNANRKWFGTARYNTCVGLLDDNGTPFDEADDHTILRTQWTDQHGKAYEPHYMPVMMQDQRHRVWLGTDKGTGYIDSETDFFTSNAIVIPDIQDNNGENPLAEQMIQGLCEDKNGYIWIGTSNLGVYVLNSDATELIAHYTTDNSAMPSNSVLSLACKILIGTAEGLVEYDPDGSGEGLPDQAQQTDANEPSYGSMRQWTLHFSYTEPTQIAASPEAVYAVANGSLFSVDRADESIMYWTKEKGLSGTSVVQIAYDASAGCLVIAYADGRMDLLYDNGEIAQMPDLSLKAGSIPTYINCLYAGKERTYAGTPFGILALNTRKGEIADTYYIGEEASAVEVQHILATGDSLYAFSYDLLYKASLHDNLVDYIFWQTEPLPFESVQQAALWRDRMYVLQHDSLFRREGTAWVPVLEETPAWIHVSDGQFLLFVDGKGTFRMEEDESLTYINKGYRPNDGMYTKGEYWLAQNYFGLVRLDDSSSTHFDGGGPNSNFGYFMASAHQQIYSAVGGRWASPYVRFGKINIYDGKTWRNIDEGNIGMAIGKTAVDISSLAIDPQDPGHFFAASYGRGVFEFRDYTAVRCYSTGNSSLREAGDGLDPELYTYTDGATIDDQGNLWVLNATSIGQPIHILTPDGLWYPLQERCNGLSLQFTTPTGVWPDKRNSRYKWMMDQRSTQGLILLDDGGTPTYSGDDYCFKRETFTDQNGNFLTPNEFRCFVQDQTNRIWLGTESGIITIPASVDFYTSDACHRIIIPRNDGTGLGDYLLGDEQINCMALDGGNRMWIGTANSGLYLIEDDTITVAHFTEDNSLLPSNYIVSITIEPLTGEVFVGTDNGIASYRSDASEPQKDMSNVYAWPNPVRPGYEGYISITGLMDNTVVNIVDAGGNLVCKTRSNGGTAVWDGKDAYGNRATPGVYTALCNAQGGHTAVKILVIR